MNLNEIFDKSDVRIIMDYKHYVVSIPRKNSDLMKKYINELVAKLKELSCVKAIYIVPDRDYECSSIFDSILIWVISPCSEDVVLDWIDGVERKYDDYSFIFDIHVVVADDVPMNGYEVG